MDQFEVARRGSECATHRRGPVEPAQHTAWEIGDAHAFELDRTQQRHGAVAWAVNIGGEDMDVVATRRQAATKRMNRTDRPAISHCGQIRWNHV
jgi:hypothetical protein